MANKDDPAPITGALSRESYLDKFIAGAFTLAAKRIADGTASSQIIATAMKMGTLRETLELEKLRNENQLLAAKIQEIKQNSEIKELYEDALDAMRRYSPFSPGDPDES